MCGCLGEYGGSSYSRVVWAAAFAPNIDDLCSDAYFCEAMWPCAGVLGIASLIIAALPPIAQSPGCPRCPRCIQGTFGICAFFCKTSCRLFCL